MRELEAPNRALRQDAAERESAEIVQRRMAETQVGILNALPAHIALVDTQGVIVSVNEAWRRFATANMLQDSEFCVGQDYLAVCERAAGDCSEAARDAAAGLRQVLQGEAQAYALEYPCHSPNEQRWFRLMITPLDKDRRSGAVVMHVNITERKQGEEALRTSEREFRELAEAMPQIVWITRPDGWTTYFNRQWMEYTGLTLEESLGHGWNKPFHPDDQQRAWDAWQNATATLGTYCIESRLRRVDGTYRWWLIRGVPLQDAAGTILKWFGTCTDIHELKQAQLVAFRANRGLKMLSRCNEATMRAESEQELLDRICRIAVETGGYGVAKVGDTQDEDARSIRAVGPAGAEDGYVSEISVSWDEHDLLLHAAAERRGFRGVISLPLRERQQTLGCLRLYSSEVGEPGADELNLLRNLADNLAYGIVHLRTRIVQQRLQTVLKVAAGVSATTGAAFYEQLARNMPEALGAQAGFVSQLRTGEPPCASTLSAVADGTVIENFDYIIDGTPFENLAATDSCVIAQHVAEQFPKADWLAALGAQAYAGRRLDGSTGQPLGHLAVVFREPLKDTAFVASAMQILAARAASELERQLTDAHVREQAALIDESRDAIVVRDLEHRITFWNKGAERIYGWSADEARGRLAHELLVPDPVTFDEADRAVRETGEWSGEIQNRARNAAVLIINGRWTMMRDDAGGPRAILTIDTDVTEQKSVEAQFLRAQRMESIGTLAGGIAHDLNNVFGPIMLSLDLLSQRFPDPASAELISILSGSAQHGADMVKQVLSFARGVEGRRIELELPHLIKEVEKIANDTFLKHIQVRTMIPHDLWTVVGDPTQIHQVLLNLCVNARDAMPNGGTLAISAENRILDAHNAALNLEAKVGPYVFLQVEDSGFGMSPAIIEKIFDPFFTTKKVGQGTGLGLSTSLAIVKSHGGFFRVYSESGKGTKFKVYLPAQSSAPDATAAQGATEVPHGHGELILVVDDERSVRLISNATLEQSGYRVLLASDGAEAVALYAARHAEIAVVLTDMTMPVMDGPAAIVRLRKINPAVRIIAVSGLTISGDVARACGLDMGHFLPKPYTSEALLKTLRQILTEKSE